jgi:hypothetical protein
MTNAQSAIRFHVETPLNINPMEQRFHRLHSLDIQYTAIDLTGRVGVLSQDGEEEVISQA